MGLLRASHLRKSKHYYRSRFGLSFISYNSSPCAGLGSAYVKEFIGPMTSLPGSNFISNWRSCPATFRMFLLSWRVSPRLSPVSLSLRLFNMMGDHEVIGAFISSDKLVVLVAFYFMGTLVSLIQALYSLC
jgi:F0F1-type ATP synthase membrane subunit a